MRIFSRMTWVAGFAALALMASQAAADSVFGPTGLPLTNQDLHEMSVAAQPLLNDDTLPLGTMREWSNSKSGNHGYIKLLGRFEYAYEGSKLPCRKLMYHVEVPQSSDPYNLALNRCKVADGTWKIL